jgi:ribosome biogenesis GTPase / thiamine phosphate phosphatase
MTENARIVASHGRTYIVELADGSKRICSTRGKKTDFACGDRVVIKISNAEQAVIEKVIARETLLYRSDEWKSKLIAANVTQIVIVVAPVPSWLDELIGRCLIAAESAGIKPVICLNKCDLPEAAAARDKLAAYQKLGYELVAISAQEDLLPLREKLRGHVSVLVGQSGMGKSTITNALIPDANARINDISIALDSGKHTTTHATLYHLDAESDLIDSPGLQSFGLAHIQPEDLVHYMPDFRDYIGQCRFHNCRHRQEPNCAILGAVADKKIPASRLELLHRLQDELARVSAY